MTDLMTEQFLELEDFDTEAEPTERDLVYETGNWSRFLWDELSEADPESASHVAMRYPETEWPGFVREMFARLYHGATPPMEPLPSPRLGGEWAEVLHTTAGQLPEWAELAEECKGDDQLAFLASVSVQEELELPDDQAPPEDPRPKAEEAAKAAVDGNSEASAEATAEMVKRIEQSQQAATRGNEPSKRSATRRKLRGAIRRALGEVREAKATVAMLGCGDGPTAEERIAWVNRIRENPELVEIAALAGRMEAALSAERAQARSSLGREDLVGLKIGPSLSEAVPMERALFTHPLLGFVQFAKMAEGRLLQNRQVGLVDEDHAGKGPLIFACDESGSMRGGSPSANVVAKAVALTLARRCAAEGRTFAFLHWSTGTQDSVYAHGKGLNAKLIDDICTFLNGGTDMSKAINRCAGIVSNEQPNGMPTADAELADVIFITDACSYEHGSLETACSRLSETGARLWTFHIDNGAEHQVLKERSARYTKLSGIEGNDKSIALTIHADLGESE